MRERLLALLGHYKEELKNIESDIPKEVMNGEVEPFGDNLMLCGAQDQLRVIIEDLEEILK